MSGIMKPNAFTIPYGYKIMGPYDASVGWLRREQVSPPLVCGYTHRKAARHCRDHWEKLRQMRLRPLAQTVPCPSCGHRMPSTKKGVCSTCEFEQAIAAKALAVEKRKEQEARGKVGDAASVWRTIHAASKVIADVREQCGAAPRSDP